MAGILFGKTKSIMSGIWFTLLFLLINLKKLRDIMILGIMAFDSDFHGFYVRLGTACDLNCETRYCRTKLFLCVGIDYFCV